MRSKIVNIIYSAKACAESGLIQFTTKEGFRYLSHPLMPGKWRVMLEATAKQRDVDSKPCNVDQFRSLGMPVRDERKMPSFVIPKPVDMSLINEAKRINEEECERVSVPESLGLEDPQAPLAAAPAGWTETT